MESAFAVALAFTLHWEGGFVDDPSDRGGTTKYGISQNAHPEVDINRLTRRDAMQLYLKNHWKPIRGDELPDAVSFAMFDYAVHAGPHRAIVALQRALGVKADGKIGPITLRNLKGIKPAWIVEQIMADRGLRLVALARRDPAQARFVRGWAKRLLACSQRAGELSV
jgi:lysozyme family protein